MIPRPYQSEAIDAAFREWETVRVTLVQVATGGGKTFIAAKCAERFWEKGKRTLFIVHLREIVRQAREELQSMTGLPVGLELSSEKSSSLDPEPIISASVQTLNGRGRKEKFSPEEFGLLIADEGHHMTAESWQEVFRYFPNAKILVLSATPERGDKKKIGSTPKEGQVRVESIAYKASLQDLCSQGYLVKPRQLTIEIPGLDFTKIPRKQGDLSKEELSAIMIRYAAKCAHRSIEAIFGLYPHELDSVPEAGWSEYIGERSAQKTLVFCVTRLHAEKVMNAMNSFREGLCGYVDGETPHIERRNVFRDFKHGNLAVLANCGVTTEGYDNPNIKNILLMRPTMSKSLFLQMIGRGSRTLKGTLDGLETEAERLAAILASDKPYCSIIDFTDSSRDHRLVTMLDIFGEDQPASVRREVEKRMKDGATDIEEEIKVVLKERYELRQTEYDETEIDGFTGKKKKKKLTKEQKLARAEALAKRGLSGKEFERLSQQKLHPERRTLEENRQLLKTMTHRRLSGLCSYRQGFTLQKYGFTSNEIKTMSFRGASEAIDAIAKNGWRPLPRKPEPSFTERMMNDSAVNYEYGTGEAAF